MKWIFFGMVVVVLMTTIDGFPSGPSASVCNDASQTPGHGPAPQTSIAPYTVTTMPPETLGNGQIQITGNILILSPKNR